MAASQTGLGANLTTSTVIVTEVPKMDLETYIQNYRGRTRTLRLDLISRCSTVLGLDALKLAARDAINGRDVPHYHQVIESIAAIDPNDPAAVRDTKWVEKQAQANKADLNRLQTELKAYKNNLVKESIRMGNEDLAKFFESMDQLQLAYDVYSKMRAEASLNQHVLEVGWHLARISVLQRDWSMAISNVNKMSGANMIEHGDNGARGKTNIVYGIGLLGLSKYVEAASAFLRVDPSVSPSLYDEFASPNDIATYGGLLALATMDRKALSRFLDDSPFRTFMELEPQFRRAITLFVNGRYSACLAILASHRPDYMLDIYLQPHVDNLYGMIRSKCIFHFLQPFSCVTIDSMNAAFASPGESIEAEVIHMIRHSGLQARIDPIDRVITSVKTNPRGQMQTEVLATAKQYEKDAIERIRRIALVSADLEVKGSFHRSGKAGKDMGDLRGVEGGATWHGAGESDYQPSQGFGAFQALHY